MKNLLRIVLLHFPSFHIYKLALDLLQYLVSSSVAQMLNYDYPNCSGASTSHQLTVTAALCGSSSLKCRNWSTSSAETCSERSLHLRSFKAKENCSYYKIKYWQLWQSSKKQIYEALYISGDNKSQNCAYFIDTYLLISAQIWIKVVIFSAKKCVHLLSGR